MKRLIIGLLVVSLLLFPGCAGQDIVDDAVTEAQIFDLINQARVEEGLPELTQDPNLYEIALEYCEEMYQEDVLTHDGFESRADSVRSNGYTLIGENLARGYDSPQALVEDWLLSPGHQENILNPLFFFTGLACYNGYTCQIFGGYDLEPFIKPLIPLGLWP
jgi:uncharacterized protein YkwD